MRSMDECNEETWSGSHFTSDQMDAYWISCTSVGPHTQHEDTYTGLRWFDDENSTLLQQERRKRTMLFMTYRPKTAKNVKAEQITAKNIAEIAASFNGSARVITEENSTFLKIATLDGVVIGLTGEWIVRHEDRIESLSDEEFHEKYERARNLRDN